MSNDNVSTRVAFPKSKATLGGGSVDPIRITINNGVNKFPGASIDYQPTQVTDSTTSVAPKELTNIFADGQRDMFEAAKSASIEAEDGLGGSISFGGFLTNHAYQILAGNVGYSATVAHGSAEVDTLSTSIYYDGHPVWRHKVDAPRGDTLYGSWLGVVLDSMILEWLARRENNPLDNHTKRIQSKQHENNQIAVEIWKSILDNSTAVNEKLSDFIDESMFYHPLSNAIMKQYSASYGTFMQLIQQFCMQFQMLYVPSLEDGNYGKLINIRDTVVEGEEKEALIQQMSLSSGSTSLLPVTQVAVKGLPSEAWRSAFPNDIKNAAVPHMSVVPTEVERGRIYEISAPSWFNIKSTPVRPEGATATNPPDLDTYETTKTLVNNDFRETFNPAVIAVVDEWAKDAYVDMALADSTATLIIALDFTWEIGKVYKVRTGEGTILFSGFLHSLTHTLSSNPASPQAATNLFFTHVRGDGFKLEGV